MLRYSIILIFNYFDIKNTECHRRHYATLFYYFDYLIILLLRILNVIESIMLRYSIILIFNYFDIKITGKTLNVEH